MKKKYLYILGGMLLTAIVFSVIQLTLASPAAPNPGHTQSEIENLSGYTVPSGVIVMWSGLLVNIPAGWALADGTNGRPDLRDRFIYGWTDGVDPGATGGTTSHVHTVDSHLHSVNPAETWTVNSASGGSAGTSNTASGGHNHSTDIASFSSGSSSPGTSSENHLPSYFKLAFIIKL